MEGILLCLVLAGISAWAGERGVKMTLWKWLAAGGWIVFASLSIAVTATFLGEGEGTAALRMGAVMGAMVLISAFIILRFLGLTGRE